MARYARRCFVYSLLILSTFAPEAVRSAVDSTIRIGFFEGGDQKMHQVLRQEFRHQLALILPEGFTVSYPPRGFQTAGWKRSRCRELAVRLLNTEEIDLVVAFGPWVVEELLEAGFKRPIVAIHQFSPEAAGLINEVGRPVAENLSLHTDRNKLESDLRMLTAMVDLKKLGVLYFPSGDESEKVLDQFRLYGKMMGFEVVSAYGENAVGTYAFFNAYKQLDRDIDALYLPPLFEMSTDKTRSFFEMVHRDGIPTFSYDGRIMVELGAVASAGGYTQIGLARHAANTVLRIMMGEQPNIIPTQFDLPNGLSVNEESARKCGTDLPRGILNEAYRVPVKLDKELAPFTFPDLMQRALFTNPDYLSRQDALSAATEAASQTWSGYLPHLSLSGSAFRYDDHDIVGSGEELSKARYSSSLVLRQKLFSMEAIRAIEVASRQKEIVRVDVDQARLDLEFAVTTAFLNYARIEELIAVETRHRNLIDHHFELSRARAVLGEESAMSAVRWDSERNKVTEAIVNLRADFRIARVLLNTLVYLPVDEPMMLESGMFSPESFRDDMAVLYPHISTPAAEEQLMLKLSGAGQAASPSLESYDARLSLVRSRIARNSARYFPTLELESSLNYGDRFADQSGFAEAHRTWSIGGFFSIPLFEGSDRIREQRKLKATLSRIEYEREGAMLGVTAAVRKAVYRLTSSGDNMYPTDQAARQASSYLGWAASGYEKDEVDLTDILEARRNAEEAELAEINNRYRFYEAMAGCLHAVGWSNESRPIAEQFFGRLGE